MSNQQEPVGEAYLCDACHTPFDGAYECPSCGHNEATKESVYTSPPQHQWVGLTEEDWDYINKYCGSIRSAIQTAETLLKEKNT